MKCNCGLDHWHHVALGLQGIVGMLVMLEQSQLPCTDAALEELEKRSAQLAEHVARQKALRLENPKT